MRRPSLPKMLLRGLFRRCPWCGGRGAFYTGWTTKQPHCATCGLAWRRGDVGFELGAAAAAAIICLGPLVVLLAVMVAITWPEIDATALFVVLGAGALVLPILLYPSSYTVWQAVDILMRPPQPDDFESGASNGPTSDASPSRPDPKRDGRA